MTKIFNDLEIEDATKEEIESANVKGKWNKGLIEKDFKQIFAECKKDNKRYLKLNITRFFDRYHIGGNIKYKNYYARDWTSRILKRININAVVNRKKDVLTGNAHLFIDFTDITEKWEVSTENTKTTRN